jgi:hypothetical protein
LLKNNIVPFLWGAAGIGKTEAVKQYATENGLDFVHLHLATQEVGDLVGLLRFRDDGAVEHSRPEWFPTSGKGIIFLDELNRAHPDVIQAMFSFITHGSIHRHQKPSEWKIVAAGNYSNDNFQVTDTSDSAWLSRFCHIDVKPSVQDFAVYAMSAGERVIADFAAEHIELFEPMSKGLELSLEVNNRAMLKMIAPLEREQLEDVVRMELYSGIIGSGGAAAFLSFKQNNGRRIRIAEILKDYDKVQPAIKRAADQSSTKFDILNAPIEELERELKINKDFVTDLTYPSLVRFLEDVPLELLLSTIDKLRKLDFTMREQLMNEPKLVLRLG